MKKKIYKIKYFISSYFNLKNNNMKEKKTIFPNIS